MFRPSPQSVQVRDDLLTLADVDRAGDLAADLANHCNQILNAAGVSIATSLVARALLARALLHVAAEWWTDVDEIPTPVTLDALTTLVFWLPPDLVGRTYLPSETV